MPIPLPPAHFIFCDDLNEKDSWFPSPSAQSPTQTNRLHPWQTALGLCAVSSTQEWSIASNEKINKQAKCTPALCLRGNGWVPWLPPPVHVTMSLSPRGRTASEEKKLFLVVCVCVHVRASVCEGEQQRQRKMGVEEKRKRGREKERERESGRGRKRRKKRKRIKGTSLKEGRGMIQIIISKCE